MKERNGTNNVKGLTNDLHTIFSASKLQDHGDDKGSGSLCVNDPSPPLRSAADKSIYQ